MTSSVCAASTRWALLMLELASLLPRFQRAKQTGDEVTSQRFRVPSISAWPITP